MTLKFVIPLPPRTKKNSQRIIVSHGRPMIIPSAAYKEYEKDVEPFIPKLDKPIDFPVTVSAHFFMPTRRPCDLVNLLQSLLDILVKYGVISDDNYHVVFSVDGSRVGYDKENSRTEVEITGEEPDA